jgi:hypothetical protein
MPYILTATQPSKLFFLYLYFKGRVYHEFRKEMVDGECYFADPEPLAISEIPLQSRVYEPQVLWIQTLETLESPP